ncbi:ECF-type sigma factor [Roseateles sp. DC23W]|uniref:ECF-type sigma factor n=1 Tax=Pelomonas dachongensis TaxID=3299029 RepID=A0ABW7ETN4_9BURK
MSTPTDGLTALLQAARDGDPAATAAAWPLIYPELRRIARARLRGPGAPSLATEELLHEGFLRLAAAPSAPLADRHHFYALAAKAMRHIVIDHLRRRHAQARGGDWQALSWDTAVVDLAAPAREERLLALDGALQALDALEPALAQLVELRFFGGYTEAETADALGTSERTVRRQWAKARAFLLVQLDD